MSGFYSSIARYYDAENKDKGEDIAMYMRLADEYGGPIIDIGCGSGRIMVPLAQQGHDVHGIDNDNAMVDIAERYASASPILQKNMTLYRGDILDYELDKKFKLVLVPYNTLMHFHELEDQVAVVTRLRELVMDDGMLVLDLSNAGAVFATKETDALIYERTFLEPDMGHMVMQYSHSYFDRTAQLLYVTWIYDEITGDGTVKRTSAPMILYYYFHNEIRLLLDKCGFDIEAAYGDTDLGPFEDGCDRMIVFAKPRL